MACKCPIQLNSQMSICVNCRHDTHRKNECEVVDFPKSATFLLEKTKAVRIERQRKALLPNLADRFAGALLPGGRYFDGSTVWSLRSPKEEMRANWTRFILSLRLTSFGTLTLRSRHGQNCPRVWFKGVQKFVCDGGIPELRGTPRCRVPGVQRTETLVRGWLASVDAAFVVEEFGTAKGRRHFHYLAVGTETLRTESGKCVLCMANIPHNVGKRLRTANKFWRDYGGFVDEKPVIDDPKKCAEYVTKYLDKGMTDEYGNDDDDEHDEQTRYWYVERRRKWRGSGFGSAENDDADDVSRYVLRRDRTHFQDTVGSRVEGHTGKLPERSGRGEDAATYANFVESLLTLHKRRSVDHDQAVRPEVDRGIYAGPTGKHRELLVPGGPEGKGNAPERRLRKGDANGR